MTELVKTATTEMFLHVQAQRILLAYLQGQLYLLTGVFLVKQRGEPVTCEMMVQLMDDL